MCDDEEDDDDDDDDEEEEEEEENWGKHVAYDLHHNGRGKKIIEFKLETAIILKADVRNRRIFRK